MHHHASVDALKRDHPIEDVVAGYGVELRRSVRHQHHGGVLFPEREEPLLDAVGEYRPHERRPQLLDYDQRRTSVELTFDAAKEVKEHGDEDLVVHVHELS